MTCTVCGRNRIYHCSEIIAWSESGCHDGVFMDDDEYAEGWQRDVIYPPCKYSPLCCRHCEGSGESRDPASKSDDCEYCSGTGWLGGKAKWPIAAEEARAAAKEGK